jgi:hypothetical protein
MENKSLTQRLQAWHTELLLDSEIVSQFYAYFTEG